MGTVTDMAMSKTWMVRGSVGGVLAVVSAAWALGIAATGGTTARDSARPADPDPTSVSVPEELDGDVAGLIDERAIDPAEVPSPSGSADPVDPSASADPTDLAPGLPALPVVDLPPTPDADQPAAPKPTKAAPTRTPSPTKPSDKPTKTPPPSTPSPTPSPSPTQPANQCTDLISALNCVLAPITKHP